MRQQHYSFLVLTITTLLLITACSTKPVITTVDILNSANGGKPIPVKVRRYEDKFFWSWLGTYPQRWELVVFKPESKSTTLTVARVIGLPGEQVSIKNAQLLVNGKVVELPNELVKTKYLNIIKKIDLDKKSIKESHYFLLSDAGDVKNDSRKLGQIPKKDIIGRITGRVAADN